MYSTFVFGLNYESADFGIWGKFAFAYDSIPNIIDRLQNSGVTREIIILSTCNRSEVYCVTQDIDLVINTICDIKNVCPRTIKKHGYIYSGNECARHIFRVASGLESMILGETEIVAQIKDALVLAQEQKSITTQLSVLFNMALAVEKDVRNYTEINNIGISFGSALVNLIAVNFKNLVEENILFIGAGKMMMQIAPHFHDINFRKKSITNRTYEKAEILAKKINSDVFSLNDLSNKINEYGIIIACISMDKPLLDHLLLSDVIESEQKLFIIDLSMPLISSLELRKCSNITLITIEDIAKIVDIGIQRRRISASCADKIIEAKLLEYLNWQKKRSVTPLIKALRDSAEDIRLNMLAVAQNQLNNGDDIMEILNHFSIKLVNKLLHHPTVNLSAVNDEMRAEVVNVVNYLYALDLETADIKNNIKSN